MKLLGPVEVTAASDSSGETASRVVELVEAVGDAVDGLGPSSEFMRVFRVTM